MTINEIKSFLEAEVHCDAGNMEDMVHTACGSDMMSDVLAFVKDQSILLTGLVNSQVIRTAEMMDFMCVVFVRGKRPNETMIEMAKERGITLLSTDCRMFVACGVLYKNGLTGGTK